MKKFLSLVLALVMTMSLVTVSAGAVDFTDDSDIDYEEAVDVISALGIVDGYSDDSFRPDGSLTRGAAAKIICNLILGPTTASALSATTAPFKDVPVTNTFAGYITYCSQQGIISGYGDGTFRPTGSLTGNAFMKMLLGALGYDSSIEGYTGANWQVNVVKQAVGIGLDDGNDDFVGSRTVTRQEAALYAFNMLQADMVQYDSKTTVDINGATVTIAGNKAQAIPQRESGYEDTLGDDDVLQFAEKYFPRLTKTTTNEDAFGRPANEWKYRSEIIGLYASDATLIGTYEGTKAEKGDLYDLVGASIVKELDEDGKTVDGKHSYELRVFVDGAEVDDTQINVEDYFVRNSSAAAEVSDATFTGNGKTGNGVLTEVYMDDDNNVTIVIVNTYLVKATADYNANREELTIETVEVDEANDPTPNLPASISMEDLDVSGFKEGDYILVTVSLQGRTPSIESVEAAEMVTGTVTEYTETKNAVIGGNKYSYNELVGEDESNVEYTIDADATVVLDAYGYILYVDEAVSTSSYVYIQEADQAVGVGTRYAANAFFADGTNDAIILKKVAGSSTVSALSNAGGWYTFIKDANDRYSLSTVKAPQSTTNSSSTVDVNVGDAMAEFQTANQTVITNSKVSFLNGDDVKANANTVFVLWNAKNETYVYQGIANAPTVKVGSSALTGSDYIRVNWIEKNGYATYVFIDTHNDDDAVIEDVNNVADYLFILDETNRKTVIGEDTYYQYKVLFDGEETTKFIEQDIINDLTDDQGVMVYNVKANDKEYITSASLFVDKTVPGAKQTHQVTNMTMAAGNQLTQSGKTISITGDTDREYLVDDDTVINLIVGEGCGLLKDEGASYELYQNISANSLAGLVKGYELNATVYAVTDDADSDVLDYLYVYVTAIDDAPVAVDPDILSVTVKGQTPVRSNENGVDGEVTLTKSQNDAAVQRLEVELDGTTVPADSMFSYAYAATLPSSWTDNWGGWDDTAALDTSGGSTLYVKIETASDEYVLKITLTAAAASAPTLTSLAPTEVKVDSGKVTIKNSYATSGITVGELAAVLDLTGDVDGDYIEITFMGETADNAMDITGLNIGRLKVVVHGDAGTGSTEYTVEFGTI